MYSNRYAPIVIILVLLGILSTSCGSSPATEAAAPTAGTGDSTSEVLIEIKLFNFQKKEITVPVGTRVTWVNRDGSEHSVTSGTPKTPDGIFDSGFFNKNETFSMVFNTPGEFQYFCRRHNHMRGVVIVTAP